MSGQKHISSCLAALRTALPHNLKPIIGNLIRLTSFGAQIASLTGSRLTARERGRHIHSGVDTEKRQMFGAGLEEDDRD